MATQLVEVKKEESMELEKKALSWPDRAQALRIVDQSSYEEGAGLLISIADLEAEIIEHHKEPKRKAHETHKAIVAAEKKLLDPLTKAKGIIKRSLGVWTAEQERIRQEEERKAREEAQQREEEARLKLAEEAQKQGATEQTVDEILETPLPQIRPVVKPTYEKVSNVSGREYWKWEIIDANQIPREYLTPDTVKINGIVRAMKGATKIAGIKVFSETSMSVRR